MAARIDAELDLHGYTAASARDQLESVWSRRSWQGMRRVRIIHGTGAVLHKVVRHWAEEKAIPYTLEQYNPGVTILQPSLRRNQTAAPPNRPLARHLERLRKALPATPTNNALEEVRSSRDQPPEVANDARSQQAMDLFAEAMEQISREDPRATHRRKQGL